MPLSEAEHRRLRPVIGLVFRLEAVAVAHAAIATRSAAGKTLLSVASAD